MFTNPRERKYLMGMCKQLELDTAVTDVGAVRIGPWQVFEARGGTTPSSTHSARPTQMAQSQQITLYTFPVSLFRAHTTKGTSILTYNDPTVLPVRCSSASRSRRSRRILHHVRCQPSQQARLVHRSSKPDRQG